VNKIFGAKAYDSCYDVNFTLTLNPFLPFTTPYLISKAQAKISNENIEHDVLNIILQLGYGALKGHYKNEDIELITPLVKSLKSDIDNLSDFIQIKQLELKVKLFKSLYYKIFIMNIFKPKYVRILTVNKIWDEYVYYGKSIINNAYDIIAIKIAYQNIKIISPELVTKIEIWDKIIECETFLFKKIINNRKKFYPLSEQLFEFFTNYTAIPEGKFKLFMSNIFILQKNCVKINHYQKDINDLEANNILNKIQIDYRDYPTAAQAHLYDIALAENTIKWQLLRLSKIYSNNENNLNIKNGSLIKDTKVFTLRIANSLYSLHMSDPDRHTWLIPKKRMVSFLSRNDVEGALFFSRRRVSDNCLRIQFQNFVKTEPLKKKIVEKKEGLNNLVILIHKDIFKKDLRDSFLKNAAIKAIGLSHVQEDLKFKARQTIFSLSMKLKQLLETHFDYFTMKKIAIPAFAFASLIFFIYFSLPTPLSDLVHKTFHYADINEITFIDEKPLPWEVSIKKYGFSSPEEYNKKQKAFGAGLWMARKQIKKDEHISQESLFFLEDTNNKQSKGLKWTEIEDCSYYWLGQWVYVLRNICLSGNKIPKTFWNEQAQIAELLTQKIKKMDQKINDNLFISDQIYEIYKKINDNKGLYNCDEIVVELDRIIQILSPE